MGYSITAEFEPEYYTEFRTYMKLKETMALALFAIESLKNGKVSRDVKERVLRSLKATNKGLEYRQRDLALPTFLSNYLDSLYEDEDTSAIAKKIQATIALIEKDEAPEDKLYSELHGFYSKGLGTMTQTSRELEEKMFGRAKSSRTYHP